MRDVYTVEERYRSDPVFHAIVEHLYALLIRADMTPSQVREALFLATMKVEETRVRVTKNSSPHVQEFFDTYARRVCTDP